MKKCFKCEKSKPLSEFYSIKGNKDGLSGKCKECTRKDSKETRAKRIDYYREYDRNRGNRHSSDYIKEFREKYPKKYKAQNMINNAVRDGRMKKSEECQSCGSCEFIHGHHDDYDFPLTVRWLCASCHSKWHKENGEGLNAI